MQERYLGDSHDFLKYALLRHIGRSLGIRIGVNWYLTDPERVDKAGNNDGEKRHHLNGKDWRSVDPELFDLIGMFADPSNRKIEYVEGWNVLPANTVYFDTHVPTIDRHGWYDASQGALTDADLVFLDPDNGFEVKSMTSKTAPKYAFYREAAGYLDAGKMVISIQFARQCDPVQRGLQTRETLCELSQSDNPLPIVRGRVAPNILFLALAPSAMVEPLAAAMTEFAGSSAKTDIIT
ncbi:hypothetical protein SAMN05444678_12615 [Sphingomonas sp. YR710]|uniref:hypothetical protein n=1 Tax=Sphingomonas sp. YR710 TaxID=1882773 RepID=UPI00088B2CF5|nr:hypothetical protein [Sphingomonas sp. YR710]SDD85026.1 hypothetical protein SAMN05444678_12615 [Sphingomonas sp. YR710]